MIRIFVPTLLIRVNGKTQSHILERRSVTVYPTCYSCVLVVIRCLCNAHLEVECVYILDKLFNQSITCELCQISIIKSTPTLFLVTKIFAMSQHLTIA